MIRIENLNKYYNKGRKNQIHVINNTNIELPDNGLIALLGPSGCGKTTLLNAIGGLDRVNKGNIYINDLKITSKLSNRVDKIRNLNIGYIFQDYKLIDDMSVYDNVAMVLKMIGIKDKSEIKKRVEYILERVGMYRYRYRPCGMLSGGERQRVGIARAIVKNPQIILADEPTGNLDSKNTIEIMNIIKSISKDKLVILVTHEVDLAKFYADRILEISDGEIKNDYLNKNNGKIDYRIDNTFYLKDFKYHNKNDDNKIKIDYYSDSVDKLNLVVIYKNGNIYIKNNDIEKVEVIDNNSNIEVIDDHYKQLDKSVYEKYSFDFDKIINNNMKIKYSSIFNMGNIIIHGFKKIKNYSFMKKLLLVGFFLSAIFTTYSISNIFGLLKIEDKDFITSNKNYLTTNVNKIKVNDYLDYEKIEGIEYIIPTDSIVRMTVDSSNYFQTKDANMNISGSLASIEMISDKDLILGRMPENNREIVIDKMVYEKTRGLEMIGYYELERMIDSNVSLIDDILEYKIVGIVSLESPSIYVNKDEMFNIISNSKNGLDDDYYFGSYDSDMNMMNSDMIYDYNLYKDNIKITKGREPVNDYEVIINEDYSYEYGLNKEIDKKVNDKKLVVVGYYKANNKVSGYFVNSNTKKYKIIEDNSNGIRIYTKDKDKVIKEFNDKGIKLLSVYDVDKDKYMKSIKESINSSLVVALVMLGISLIEIILMVRSSFLSRIKEIGIYRAIGVKKMDIYKMFTSESFAITTLASIPGVLFMSYCLYVLKDIEMISRNYEINIYIVILCVLVLYIFNIIVGLIPVFNTMRKSPASILSSHEID